MSASRRQQMANDLAARAIAAAERRRREAGVDNDAVAERLRSAAGEDGTLSVDAALAALKGEERRPWNPFAESNERQEAKQRRGRELLFGPEPDEHDPSPKPEGSADGGEGETENATYDYTEDGQRLRVWPIDE